MRKNDFSGGGRMDDRTLNQLAEQAKSDKEAEEKIYALLEEESERSCQNLARKNPIPGTDWTLFKDRLYQMTGFAIRHYDGSKGNFINYWRKARCTEQKRFLSKSLEHQKKEKRFILFENEIPEYDSIDDGRLDARLELGMRDQDETQRMYEKEMARNVFDYVELRFSKRDREMIVLWCSSYTYEEIARIQHRKKTYVRGRIYTVLTAVRKEIGGDEVRLARLVNKPEPKQKKGPDSARKSGKTRAKKKKKADFPHKTPGDGNL